MITLSCWSCLEFVGVEKYRGLLISSLLLVLRLWLKLISGVLSLLIIHVHLKGVSETAWNDLNVKFFRGELLAFSPILLVAWLVSSDWFYLDSIIFIRKYSSVVNFTISILLYELQTLILCINWCMSFRHFPNNLPSNLFHTLLS